jgi:predicted Zn finger-like uncharacterized protein
MLIVCPSCATSYMIEPASVSPAGRNVRCARCRETWFVNPPQVDEPVDAFVNGIIAEAEAEVVRPPDPVRESEPSRHTEPDVYVREEPDYAARYEPGEPAAPVHIADAPSVVPPIDHMPIPEPIAESASEEAENFTDRRRRLQVKRQKARRSSRWTAIVLVLFAFNVALVGARSEVVRYLPQTASLFAAIGLPVNLRHLTFEDVRVTREEQKGGAMLSIQGKIVSKASKPVDVPRLRFAARTKDGREVYTWTARPERNVLQPGESLNFRSFAKPPEDAVDIMVRFFNAQDATGN